MSGDKDIENDIPLDQDQHDDPAMDVSDSSGFPEDDHNGAAFSDEDFGEELGGEEDFIEEDWEAYDEESFIDDSDGDGFAERKAAFNKLIIGSAVAIVLAAGGYFLMTASKPENLGAPVMEQVADATPVSPDQKVEFHSETKLQPKDSFGVTYGKQEEATSAPIEQTGPQEGLMNDPKALARLRNREDVVPQRPAEQDDYGDYDETLPMPSPMSQSESLVPEEMAGTAGGGSTADGLIPMPEPLRGPSRVSSGRGGSSDMGDMGNVSAGIPRAPDVTRANAAASPDGAEFADLTEGTGTTGANAETGKFDEVTEGLEPVRASGNAPGVNAALTPDLAAVSAKLDQIGDRLDNIEDRMEKIDQLQSSVSKLEGRIAKLESAPAKSASQQKPVQKSSAAPSRNKSAITTASSGAVAQDWVLKSAQPGQAMVAKRGESEMYSVSVGETFNGIGRVTGIHIENGRWVVQGTAGRISQ